MRAYSSLFLVAVIGCSGAHGFGAGASAPVDDGAQIL